MENTEIRRLWLQLRSLSVYRKVLERPVVRRVLYFLEAGKTAEL